MINYALHLNLPQLRIISRVLTEHRAKYMTVGSHMTDIEAALLDDSLAQIYKGLEHTSELQDQSLATVRQWKPRVNPVVYGEPAIPPGPPKIRVSPKE